MSLRSNRNISLAQFLRGDWEDPWELISFPIKPAPLIASIAIWEGQPIKRFPEQFFVSPEEIQRELELTYPLLEKKPDYITLSGSGEPTLNQNMGEIIHTIKRVTSIPWLC